MTIENSYTCQPLYESACLVKNNRKILKFAQPKKKQKTLIRHIRLHTRSIREMENQDWKASRIYVSLRGKTNYEGHAWQEQPSFDISVYNILNLEERLLLRISAPYYFLLEALKFICLVNNLKLIL